MNKVRKVLHEILVNSLNTSQINDLGRNLDSNFSIHKVSGFGDKIVIPRKVAADCIINYFRTEDKLLEFISYMISQEGHNASGGVVHLKGLDRLIQILQQNNWIYDEANNRFQRDQSGVRTADWGLLREGVEYHLVFTSIDVVGSSDLVKINIKDDVDVTLSRLRMYLSEHVEKKNGRIWLWQGDGCLATFYGHDAITRSVISMIQILAYLPIFNISKNELRAENDIKLRIGIHYGSAVYQHDVTKIISYDIRTAMEVEKNCSRSNSIAITKPVFESLWEEIRSVFTIGTEYNHMKVYLYESR